MRSILLIGLLAGLCACTSAPAPRPSAGVVRADEVRQFCPSNWFELFWLSLYITLHPPQDVNIRCAATN